MGTSDLRELFGNKRNKTFKVSVIVSYILFFVMLGFYIHALINLKNHNVIDLSLHKTVIVSAFFVGMLTFMMRNIAIHRVLKGMGVVFLKLFVLFIAAFLLYAMSLQTILVGFFVTGLPVSDVLFLTGTLVTLTLIKIILG